jgi:hypothetical protein
MGKPAIPCLVFRPFAEVFKAEGLGHHYVLERRPGLRGGDDMSELTGLRAIVNARDRLLTVR